MNYQYLPSTFIHNLINKYLVCHDQLKASIIYKELLVLNEQTFATMLRSSSQINLTELFRSIIRNYSKYIEINECLCIENLTVSWPYILPRSFDVNTLNKPDLLTSHELNFFHLYGEIPPTPPQIVTAFQDFHYNLTQRFSFNKIAPFINFNLFSLLGGSVLMSILHDVPETMTSDLDFFYVSHSFNNFIQTIRTIQHNLSNIYFTKNTILSRERVYQRELILCTTIRELIQESTSQKKILLQFIYHPKLLSIETYLMAFELDIAQIAYNGRKVVCTWAWIWSINTSTFICYNLTNNIHTLKRAAVRIKKIFATRF
ncbi:unnamed protein product [Adineta steineri]|uniref:Uncharacterized protein n=1 Tax=Adineta steineri TaxID=433720 RepID=A0A814L5I0_9BILA|nr:unnamed protein product [Adineta steineri]CAF1126500.1 unnamed protein product [Adineta steineri]